MGRYSPTYLPLREERNYGSEFAGAIAGYIGAKRGERQEEREEDRFKREQSEAEYQRERRERLDPLEEALFRGQLHERGIVPEGNEEQEGGGLATAIDNERGRDLLSGRAKFGDQGFQTGLNAPGSFNPGTGTFNQPGGSRDLLFRPTEPRPGGHDLLYRGEPGRGRLPPDELDRVPMGGGMVLDPRLTERGRRETDIRRQRDLAVARGVDPGEAELEIRGGGLNPEHLHPGPYHPRTLEDALNYEKQLIRARGEANARGDSREDKDPEWKERRDSWAQELGRPTNRLQQDILNALADGDEPDEILNLVPRSLRAEAENYLRRATRRRRRATGGGAGGGY